MVAIFNYIPAKLDPLFSRERSSTGSNDCFVVVVVFVIVGIFIL
jgi:hypothetical protein